MLHFLIQVWESLRFAASALKANLLRTVLSLLGVTVGIYAIIGILTAVDSLEKNIKDSFAFLGSEVIYLEKWPYGTGGEYPWWKYLMRPQPNLQEYRYLKESMNTQAAICIFANRGGSLVKFENNSYEDTEILGTSEGLDDVFEISIEKGRYFSGQELFGNRNVVIIGHEVAENLFGQKEPVGADIKIKGLKYRVIGVMEKEGETLFSISSRDKQVILPYGNFKKLYYTNRFFGASTTIALKGKEDDTGLINLENEARGLMRSRRGLKPKEDDDFAINRPEVVANTIGNVFGGVRIFGVVVGLLAILVGGIGIANIMFVSVQERINQIGIQKALGAKNYFVLLQFLFEAVFLSLVGGLTGLASVWLTILLVQSVLDLGSFAITLSVSNILLGLTITTLTGLLAGIIPAAKASSMDPVDAMRA